MIKFDSVIVDRGQYNEQIARCGELEIVCGMSHKVNPVTAEFLPNKVLKDGKLLWEFDKSRHNGNFAYLREVAGVPVIVYASCSEVCELVFLDELGTVPMLGGGNYAWGRSPLERADLKLKAADQMGRKPQLGKIEEVLKRRLEAERAEAAKALAEEARAAEEQARQERLAARQARRDAIRARGKLQVYGPSDQKLYGFPVVGDEWQSLPNGTDCVLVSSWPSDGTGEPLEHFFVKVHGSKKSKARVVTSVTFATAGIAKSKGPVGPEAKATFLVERPEDGELLEVLAYDQADLRALLDGGLNSGTILARFPLVSTNERKAALVIFEHGGMRDLGHAAVLAEELT